MLRNRIYYSLKPLLPRRLRLSIRRWWIAWKRQHVGAVWPILPGSERKPENWQGWPEGKQFAVVLTHDVESAEGLANVRAVAEMEMELGFRSSFNFIPEGEYQVTDELRHWLSENGFEVGIHDLRHDGKLYASREAFRANAERINHYVKAWQVSGFRSGFMLRNLDWLHDLDVEYDLSCFDTDPFEPQPDGANTIFPFWVHAKKSLSESGVVSKPGQGSAPTRGYVELPYTLAQDSTVFLMFSESGIGLWQQKCRWIAQHGGMALLNVHPDYMDFSAAGNVAGRYPASAYRDFLQFVRHEFAGRFWAALPRAVNAFWRSRDTKPRPTSTPAASDWTAGPLPA